MRFASSSSPVSSARATSPFEARRQPDQALGVLGEVLAVDARLVVVAVEVRVGDEPAQVLVAGPVPREQDQVVGLGVRLALAVGHRAPRDVGLDADDRLDLGLLARLVEGDRAVQRAVVGQGERIEAERLRLVDQLGDPPRPSSRLNSEWTWRCVKSFGAMLKVTPF